MASFRLWLAFGLAVIGIGHANDCHSQDDDEEFRPGLIAEYRAGDRKMVRVDADVAFAWDDATPDSRLPSGSFEATWRGFVLIRLEAKHRLHAFVQGDVSIELDGKHVLKGSAKQPQWISGEEFVPGFGERPLVVTFRKTEPAAQLKLFWSSDAFGLEPLPSELLFHERTPAELTLIERGRQQFAAFRCGRCHVRDHDGVAASAPALQHVAAGMTAEQIVKRLTSTLNSPEATEQDRRMPHFRLDEEQARHLAAFLVQLSAPVKLDEPKALKTKPPKEGDPVVTPQRRGEVLIRSIGCLACHRFGDLGNSNNLPFAGPDLTSVGTRRSQSWLLTWLSDPQRLNADHRMPVFTLTDEERHEIVAALKPMTSADLPLRNPGSNSGLNGGDQQNRPIDKSKEPSTESPIDAGRRLFVEHQCAACHRVSDAKLADIARPKNDLSHSTDWSQSCLDEQWVRDDQRYPIYPRSLDRAAINAFLLSRGDRKLSHERQFVRGARMLEEKNCLACHPRHESIGLGRTAKLVAAADKDLNGQAPSLVPPSLNAVGDKLLDEALSIAVRGERQPVRMPWLKVRMPKFKHSPDELATLTRFFVEHDRIPDSFAVQASREPSAPGSSAVPTGGLTPPDRQGKVADAHTLLAGQALTGVRGWSCIACHKIGDYEPKQVALGARGSDLKMLGKHIRPEFFFRWIASPLRVIPGVEMPQFNRPVAGVLDGNLSEQHAALWQALNDPNFQPPTNPNNVEQLWVVNPGERPRIIRDVFQLPKELGGGNVPRSFAVGFDNGHSFLFDLGTASLRQWTFGDFARQQVVGKRWYWEMAGVSLMGFGNVEEIRLTRLDKHEMRLGAVYRLRYSEHRDVKDVSLSYRRSIDHESELSVVQWWKTGAFGDGRSGLERNLNLILTPNAPDDEAENEFLIHIREPIPAVGNAAAESKIVEASYQNDPKVERWTSIPIEPLRDNGELHFRWKSNRSLRLKYRYSAPVQRPPQSTIGKPIVKAEKSPIRRVPGFEGWQLPIDSSVMPTAIAWTNAGKMAFTSLKGHVFLARDSDGDGIEDELVLVHEGLSAPFGLISQDKDTERITPALTPHFSVAHRPELLSMLNVENADPTWLGMSDTGAEGWGYTDDYHEWTSGIVRDSQGRLIIGLASDYTDKNRPKEKSRWRGKVLRIDERAKPKYAGLFDAKDISPEYITPIGHAFRYPTGIAINERDEVFVSDQQGVQNCFNEINYLVEGAHYGVPSTHEEDKDAPETKAAIQIPHPWTRSVNGLCFLTGKEGYPDLKGHGIGCEFNGRFLIRFTTQRVGDVMQGAVYPFSMTDDEVRSSALRRSDESKDKEQPPQGGTTSVTNFEGPLCCGVSPKGEIYIGSIADSGWAGGQNTGSIVKLKGNGQRPNGIREIRATRDGFEIEFFAPVDRDRATNGENYSISGYTRVWGGAYATPDSDRHRCKVLAIELSDDGKTAKLKVDSRKTPNYVYDISCRDVAPPDKAFFPSYGFFTLHRIPNE